jgi:hypothetical protein
MVSLCRSNAADRSKRLDSSVVCALYLTWKVSITNEITTAAAPTISPIAPIASQFMASPAHNMMGEATA